MALLHLLMYSRKTKIIVIILKLGIKRASVRYGPMPRRVECGGLAAPPPPSAGSCCWLARGARQLPLQMAAATLNIYPEAPGVG